MEMTDSHSLLLGLIACAIIADGTAALVCKERIYHGLARAFSARSSPEPQTAGERPAA
jgi:H+/Cl- antiporter ClcA